MQALTTTHNPAQLLRDAEVCKGAGVLVTPNKPTYALSSIILSILRTTTIIASGWQQL